MNKQEDFKPYDARYFDLPKRFQWLEIDSIYQVGGVQTEFSAVGDFLANGIERLFEGEIPEEIKQELACAGSLMMAAETAAQRLMWFVGHYLQENESDGN